MTTQWDYNAQWAIGLAEKLLATDVPRRWAHAQGAIRRARSVTALTEQDADLLVTAVALHDIGFSHRLGLEPSGFPVYDAVRYLESINAPRRLIGLVANHANARVEGDLRGLGEQIARYEDEKTLLRDALWYSCLTAGPDGRPMDFESRVAEWLERYAPDPVMGTFTELSLPELRGRSIEWRQPTAPVPPAPDHRAPSPEGIFGDTRHGTRGCRVAPRTGRILAGISQARCPTTAAGHDTEVEHGRH